MTTPFRSQYRELTDEEKNLVGEIKSKAEWLFQAIEKTKPNREASLAKTKLEETVMWAVKGITG